MSDFGSSAARQRRLASELRRLRRRARLTGKDVSARLGWSEAKLSRIENWPGPSQDRGPGRVPGSLPESPARTAPSLSALAQESREADPLEELEDVPAGHAQILEAESEAESMWIWEPQVVPGLLQTEDYTRALWSSGLLYSPGLPPR